MGRVELGMLMVGSVLAALSLVPIAVAERTDHMAGLLTGVGIAMAVVATVTVVVSSYVRR